MLNCWPRTVCDLRSRKGFVVCRRQVVLRARVPCFTMMFPSHFLSGWPSLFYVYSPFCLSDDTSLLSRMQQLRKMTLWHRFPVIFYSNGWLINEHTRISNFVESAGVGGRRVVESFTIIGSRKSWHGLFKRTLVASKHRLTWCRGVADVRVCSSKLQQRSEGGFVFN